MLFLLPVECFKIDLLKNLSPRFVSVSRPAGFAADLGLADCKIDINLQNPNNPLLSRPKQTLGKK